MFLIKMQSFFIFGNFLFETQFGCFVSVVCFSFFSFSHFVCGVEVWIEDWIFGFRWVSFYLIFECFCYCCLHTV